MHSSAHTKNLWINVPWNECIHEAKQIQAKYLNKAGDNNNNTEINGLCIFCNIISESYLEMIKTISNNLDYRKHRGFLTECPPTLCLFGTVQISRNCLSRIVQSPHSKHFLWLDSHAFQWERKFPWMISGSQGSSPLIKGLAESPHRIQMVALGYVVHSLLWSSLSNLHSNRRQHSAGKIPHFPQILLTGLHSSQCAQMNIWTC